MNAAKMTLTSTILAAALGLALGLAAAPAMADKPVCPGHDHGCGTDSEDATIFAVELDLLSGPNGGSVDCIGTTNPPKLDARFGPGCSVSMDDGLELNLFATAVRTRKDGTTDLLLFFTSGDQLFPVPNETVYATDRLGANIIPGPFPDFALELNILMADMIKIHQPDKGDVVGQISVGSFFYEPID